MLAALAVQGVWCGVGQACVAIGISRDCVCSHLWMQTSSRAWSETWYACLSTCLPSASFAGGIRVASIPGGWGIACAQRSGISLAACLLRQCACRLAVYDGVCVCVCVGGNSSGPKITQHAFGVLPVKMTHSCAAGLQACGPQWGIIVYIPGVRMVPKNRRMCRSGPSGDGANGTCMLLHVSGPRCCHPHSAVCMVPGI